MRFKKKVISHLNKCYSIAALTLRGRHFFMVAAEKNDPCYLFDMQGNLKGTVWEGPGGVMSMVQIPGGNGQFLATQGFYSPNDSADACIVIVTPAEAGGEYSFSLRTLCRLPFVHRFDILPSGDGNYLIACTLKSAHQQKDDWSSPGKIYAAKLPSDLSCFNEEHPLELQVIQDGLFKNHGYCRMNEDGSEGCLVCSQQGVFHLAPPADNNNNWLIRELIPDPASDAVLVDLDGDGIKELLTISPFHGDNISIYRQEDAAWRKVYTYPHEAPFSHAIRAGRLGQTNAAIVGHREGTRDLILFTYDQKIREYTFQIIDSGCGAANVMLLQEGEREFLVAANREINEIAMYEAII